MKDWTPFRAVRRALRAFGRTKPCDPSTLRRSLPTLVIPRHPRIITAFHQSCVAQSWHSPRPVRSHRADRRGRHGRGVSRARHEAEARRSRIKVLAGIVRW